MIIDAHVHIHPDPKWFGESYDASLDTLIDLLGKSPVDKAVLLPIYPTVPNAFIAEACRKYPDRLIGFASADPLGGRKSIEQFEQDVFKYNLKGLKLHPRLQNFSLDDPDIIPLFQKAADLALPIVVDAFPQGVNRERFSPMLLERIAAAVPRAKIIMAHFGAYKLWDALFLAKANPNIFVDIACTIHYFRGSSLEKDLGFAIKKLGSDRCIYGSDHPEVKVDEAFNAALEVLNQYQLSSVDMENILGGTLSSLISL
ncbi:amidohydrolase family protein [Chloroflexota bacterium]